jgi:hypothetical protein
VDVAARTGMSEPVAAALSPLAVVSNDTSSSSGFATRTVRYGRAHRRANRPTDAVLAVGRDALQADPHRRLGRSLWASCSLLQCLHTHHTPCMVCSLAETIRPSLSWRQSAGGGAVESSPPTRLAALPSTQGIASNEFETITVSVSGIAGSIRPPIADVPLSTGRHGVACDVVDPGAHEPDVLTEIERQFIRVSVRTVDTLDRRHSCANL